MSKSKRTAPTTSPGKDRLKWSNAVRRQERIRAEQQMQEAKELEEQAKKLRDEARERRRRRQSLERHQESIGQASHQLGLDPDRPLVEVPPLPDGFKEVSRRAITPPFAFVRLSFHEGRSEHLYEVLEPRLTPVEAEVMTFLRDTLIRTLEGRERDPARAEEVLETAILTAVTDHAVMVDDISMQRIRYHLIRDFLGYGAIDVLMKDPDLEDISCDGPGIPIYLFHRSLESIRTNIVFDDDLELDSFVIRLAQQSGKHISIADPILDATLPDGSRLQATLSKEVTTRGSSFTIRKFREDPLTPTDLLHYGTMDDRLASFLWFVMENGQSLIMAGGTASGKTTTLNAISQFIPPEKKIVSIEDTREINLQHENWIAGVTRTGFGAQIQGGNRAGSINMYALLEAALRQRPEYLIVGEVRGPEALTLFQAMATGHAVYSTMHADSAESAVYRLENPPIEVPRMMLQTLDAIAIQRQVRIGDRMARRVVDITELVGFDADTGDLLTNRAFEWDVATDSHHYTGKSFLLDRIKEMNNLTDEQVMAEWDDRRRVIRWLKQKDIRDFREVARVIAHYYRRKDQLMKRIEADENGETLPPTKPPAGPDRQTAPRRLAPQHGVATAPAMRAAHTGPPGAARGRPSRAPQASRPPPAQGPPNGKSPRKAPPGRQGRAHSGPSPDAAASAAKRPRPKAARKPDKEQKKDKDRPPPGHLEAD